MNLNQLDQPKRILEDQIEGASEVLARAFQNDPLFLHCFPDSDTRKIKNALHCEFMILIGIVSGEVHITSDNIEGVGVWHPHGIKDHIISKPSKDIIRRMRRVRKEDISDPLLLKMMSIVEEIANSVQNEYVNFPHWYLSIIGVDPIHQGMGYASKLLKTKLAEIDNQNLPCFLHSENERNIQIYEHFGFKLIKKIKVPNSNLYFYGMLRKEMK